MLIQVINAPDARANSNVDATENTISAFVKICRYDEEEEDDDDDDDDDDVYNDIKQYFEFQLL